MALSTWWLFVGMTFLISATPGPNMLFVMSCSAKHGLRPSIAAMAGCMTALLTMFTLSAAGLGALLQAFPAVFDALRLGGAAYLAWLGIRSWRAPVLEDRVGEASPVPMPQASARPLALYRQGALIAASNPKAILFAAAFLPQFIHRDAPQIPQFAILLATFGVIETSWYFVYAGFGARLSGFLRRAAVLRTFNRVTGGLFVGFAALMAAVHE
jgi:threonine/homoserine/homoserine lactone efflux protein